MEFKEYFDVLFELYDLAWDTDTKNTGFGFPLNYKANNLYDDSLYLNSRIDKDGNNMYETFLNNAFYHKLQGIIDDDFINNYHPRFHIIQGSNGVRGLGLDFYDYIMHINQLCISYSKFNNVNYDLSDEPIESIFERVKNTLIEDLKNYYDVIKNGVASKYSIVVLKNKMRQEGYTNITDKSASKYMKDNSISPLDFIYFAQIGYNNTKDLLNNMKYIFEVFQPLLDRKQFLDCFDNDQLALILCNSFAEYLLSDNVIDSGCTQFLTDYVYAINEYRKINPQYNCCIKYKMNNEIKVLNVDDLIKKYDEIKEIYGIEITGSIKYGDAINLLKQDGLITEDTTPLELRNLIFSLIDKKYEEVKPEEIKNDLSELETIVTSNDDKNKLNQYKDKAEFLLDNKPIKILKGTDTFSNYYGYVYKNGSVVFDCLNKKIDSSYGNALYIISYDKIEEYSKKSKKEIRSIDTNDVTIINHLGNWKERVLEIINKTNDNNIAFDNIENIDIDSIITQEELDRLNEQLNNVSDEVKEKIEKKKKSIQEHTNIDKEINSIDKKDEDDYYNSEVNFEVIVNELLSAGKEEFGDVYSKYKEIFDKLAESRRPKTKRNPAVAAYTKLRSMTEDGQYVCELCGMKSYYAGGFDSHHVIPLSIGGVDNIYNTICLCKMCHGYIHSKNSPITDYLEMSLFDRIRKLLHDYDNEYIPYLDKFLLPYQIDDDDDDKYMNYYNEHQKIEDKKFRLRNCKR